MMRRDLSPFAAGSCYNCLGTGYGVGFSLDGHPCPCIRRCAHCDEPIPPPAEDWDDCGPDKCACGLPACSACMHD
jgi:hypothetical protein